MNKTTLLSAIVCDFRNISVQIFPCCRSCKTRTTFQQANGLTSCPLVFYRSFYHHAPSRAQVLLWVETSGLVESRSITGSDNRIEVGSDDQTYHGCSIQRSYIPTLDKSRHIQIVAVDYWVIGGQFIHSPSHRVTFSVVGGYRYLFSEELSVRFSHSLQPR